MGFFSIYFVSCPPPLVNRDLEICLKWGFTSTTFRKLHGYKRRRNLPPLPEYNQNPQKVLHILGILVLQISSYTAEKSPESKLNQNGLKSPQCKTRNRDMSQLTFSPNIKENWIPIRTKPDVIICKGYQNCCLIILPRAHGICQLYTTSSWSAWSYVKPDLHENGWMNVTNQIPPYARTNRLIRVLQTCHYGACENK